MKRIVLLGGGHAHVVVLESLARQPIAGAEVHLVTPHRRQIYSGMLPGWIAGHYPLAHCAIPLDRLAQRAGATLHLSAAIALDMPQEQLDLADGSRMAFDLLSIDTGPVAATEPLPGSAAHTLPIRPIEDFVAAWPGLVDHILGRCRRFDLAILGAGAAGVELAFAIHRRAAVEGWSHLFITLVGSDALPLTGFPARARHRAGRLLAERGIAWQGQRRAVRVSAGQLHFEAHDPLGFDACLTVTGAAAPAWPSRSGLATDDGGFIRVGPTLQSVSHAHVFAAGDIASLAEPRPKSGVLAVRAGPVLAANLRAMCASQTPEPWTPQARALYLISTGRRHALASWGPFATDGQWVWRWKDRIDRRFMRRFGVDA